MRRRVRWLVSLRNASFCVVRSIFLHFFPLQLYKMKRSLRLVYIKWSSTVFVSSWCFVACVLLPMHFSPPSPATASTMTMEEDSNISSMNNGKALFKGAGGCIGCHAAGGNIVEAGKTLSLQDLRKNGANGKEDVAEVISLGKNKMPGYGENCVGKGKCTFAKRLTEKEIDDLSAFVWNVANDESESSWAKALE